MKAVSGRGAVTCSWVTQPSARPASAAKVVSAIATPKPSTSVREAYHSSEYLRRTRASPRAAIATNSGPSTIAPITRICESSTMAMLAISVASVMNVT